MNPLDLYREFSSTWERLKSDIVAHLVLLGILYLSGYRLPDLAAIGINPKAFIDSQWHELLGSIGLPLTLTAVFAFALLVYTSLLRGIGGAAGNALYGILGTRPFTLFDERAKPHLVVVAASLPKEQLEISRLEEATYTSIREIQATQPDRVSAWLEDMGRRRDDRWTLLQDACFFPIAWLLLPLLGLPPSAWTGGNGAPILAFILMGVFAVVAVNLLRFSLANFSREQLSIVAYVLQTGDRGDEIQQRLQSHGREIVKLVEEFLKERRRYRRRPPSLSRYLQHRSPQLRRRIVVARAQRMAARRHWREFRNEAMDFEFDRRWSQNYSDPSWLRRYVQWRFARFFDRVLRTVQWFWQRLRFY